jgi:hypothetical protein
MGLSSWPTEARLGSFAGDFGDRIREAQLTHWISARGWSPLDHFVIAGLTLARVAGSLSVTVAAGDAFCDGFWIVNGSTETVSSLTPSTTNYIWLTMTETSGIITSIQFEANTTGVGPGEHHVLLGKAVTDGSEVTTSGISNSLANPRINSGSYVSDSAGAVELFLGVQPKQVVVTMIPSSAPADHYMGANMIGITGSSAVGLWAYTVSAVSVAGSTKSADIRPELTTRGFKKPFNTTTGDTVYWQAWF